jgi:hypothetical protein
MRPKSNHLTKVSFKQVAKNNNALKKMANCNDSYIDYEKKKRRLRPYVPPSNITAQAYSIYERA